MMGKRETVSCGTLSNIEREKGLGAAYASPEQKKPVVL